MSRGVFTPVNQQRLTNIAVVRYKKGGKKFELACYPNKVTSYREGVEKDLSEVIQSDIIFENVNKGTYTSENEAKQIFGTEDLNKIRLEILMKGDLQVSERERRQTTEETFKEIASIVTQKCVNPQTNRPLTITLVERAMKEDIHFSVHPSKPAKVQAMDVIKQLAAIKDFPIVRAQMRLVITLPKKDGKAMKTKLAPLLVTTESEDMNATALVMTVVVDPGNFRVIDETVSAETKGKGSVTVLSLNSDVAEGDMSIDDAVETTTTITTSVTTTTPAAAKTSTLGLEAKLATLSIDGAAAPSIESGRKKTKGSKKVRKKARGDEDADADDDDDNNG